MKINFVNQTDLDVKEYKKLIRSVLKHEKSDQFFNIIFVTSEEIRQINQAYRGIDKVTDVISFENDEGFEKYDGFTVLGDLFICISRAKSQAINYGHSMYREVCFLFTHGLLHLLKMDHLNSEDEEKMIAMQNEIMDHFKIVR